ncbi:MAG: hypothetical protein KIC77_11305 [Clostridiales bacterium]|jgi:hypothetical protein|nr:hypothetical protein [Clostridiales bacterium]
MNKTNTDCSVEMLNEIYQAASMGVDGSELLINKTEDCDFSDILHEYWNRYNDIKKEAASLLSQKGEVPKGARSGEKAGLWMGVQMNTLKDKTSSHMAEMLIQGCTMGIIKSEKHKKAYQHADQACYRLEDKFLALQKQQIEDMKKFLS